MGRGLVFLLLPTHRLLQRGRYYALSWGCHQGVCSIGLGAGPKMCPVESVWDMDRGVAGERREFWRERCPESRAKSGTRIVGAIGATLRMRWSILKVQCRSEEPARELQRLLPLNE